MTEHNLVHDTLLERRTVHFYQTKPLPQGALDRALEAAIRAPNHKLTNPWRFTLIGEETRGAITELGVRLKSEGKGLSEAKVEKIRRKLGDPPVLVVVSQALDDDPFRRREDYAAVACAIQNLSLSLWSEGIGSKWSSGGLTYHEQTYQITGIDPKAEEIVGFIWAGFPLDVPDPPRRGLEDVVRKLP